MTSSRQRYGVLPQMGKTLVVIVAIFAGSLLRAADRPVILAFGDSLTQGYGLHQEDGFVAQLGVWLDANGSGVTLINGGVSGDTTAGGAARIDWSLTDDVDGIIVELGGNDLLRGIDPAVSRANLDKILQAATARKVEVLLVGLVATRNNGPEYKAAFDAMYPALAEKYGTVFAPDFFVGMLEPDGSVNRDTIRALMQNDGIHPNADGVTRVVEGLGPYVEQLIARVKQSASG